MERQQLLEDLLEAYYEARKHKRNTINQLHFEFNQEHEIIALCDEILTRAYKIRPSICFVVDKPVKREIFAADFRDRVVHHLIFNYINPLLESQFIADSYSCRKGKGTHNGIKRVADFMQKCSQNYTQDCYVLKLDISGYFMSINKHFLWEKLQTMLQKERYTPFDEKESSCSWNDCFDFELVYYLLERVIWNDPKKDCIVKGKLSDWNGLPPTKSLFHAAPDCGLPIGNLTSQLFSNVYLHDFDCFVKNELQIEYYGRYVDDFVLIHPDKVFLLSAKEKIKAYLQKNCGLTLHPKKIYLQHYSKGLSFLGAFVKPNRIYIGNRTKYNFFSAVRETEKILSSEIAGRSELEHMRNSLNSYLGIMRHYNTYNIRRKALLGKSHKFFRYGYLANRLCKYVVKKIFL